MFSSCANCSKQKIGVFGFSATDLRTSEFSSLANCSKQEIGVFLFPAKTHVHQYFHLIGISLNKIQELAGYLLLLGKPQN